MKKRWWAYVVAAMLVAGPAAAQRKKGGKGRAARAAAAAPKAPAPASKARPGPKRIIRLKGDIIEGKIQKPEAFYVLQRTNMSFDALKLETRLVPKILQGLQKPPF